MRHNLKDSLAELDMQLKSVHHWKVEHFEMSFEEHLEQVEYNKQNKILVLLIFIYKFLKHFKRIT